MHITFLTSRFFPEHTGGTESYTYNLTRMLRNLGHEISLLYIPTWERMHIQRPYQVAIEDVVYEDMPVRKLHFDWRLAPDPHGYIYLHNPLVEHYIMDWLQKQASDIVHITSCIHLTGAAITGSRKLRKPIVLTLTQYGSICPKTTLQRSDGSFCPGRQDGLTCLGCLYGETRPLKLLRLFPHYIQTQYRNLLKAYPKIGIWNSSLNLVSAVERRNEAIPEWIQQVYLISPSRFLADILAQSGLIAAEHIHYSPHGHDVQRAAPGAQKLPSAQIRFGFTGNIMPHKGVHLMVEAFNRLQYQDKARLLIYGDMDSIYGEQVRALAGNNSAVEFRGRFDNKDIGQILREIDVIVVPSTFYENAPVTIAEAFAAKTPVIATNLGGMAEVIQHGVNGLLFRLNDVDDLYCQMQRLLDAPSLIDALRNHIPPVRTIEDEAVHLIQIYQHLLA